jgi:hypothetical protein
MALRQSERICLRVQADPRQTRGVPKLNHQHLIQQLSDQRSFIRASCVAFDGGSWAEAKRLALAVRILLHDTASCRSLLGQLGVLDTMGFFHFAGELDDEHAHALGNRLAPTVFTTPGWGLEFMSDASVPRDPPAELTELGTVHVPKPAPSRDPAAPLSNQMSFIRRKGRKRVRGNEWTLVGPWKEAAIVGTTNRDYFSRWDLITWVANKDGGAHVDPRLPLKYADYRDQLSHGFVVVGPDGQRGRTGNPVPFALRTLARELEISLDRLDLGAAEGG